MNPPVKYIAEVRGSQEVSLVGAADFDYWAERLKPEGLFPVRTGDRAELFVSAVSSRWRGVRFSEFSIAVLAGKDRGGTTRDGYFLVAAYNTSRLFTFVERNLFHTPYRRARISVGAAERPAMTLFDGETTSFHAELSNATPASRQGEDAYVGPIFLPSKPPGTQFFVRLAGFTEVYPFTSNDVLKLTPSASHPVLQELIDSRFAGSEWHIRRQATHARSKTFSRV